MPATRFDCHGMDIREKEKFERMSELLATVFAGAGLFSRGRTTPTPRRSCIENRCYSAEIG